MKAAIRRLAQKTGERVEALNAAETRTLMGYGLCHFTEIVGGGSGQELWICSWPWHVRQLRNPYPNPTGVGNCAACTILRVRSRKTFAQILCHRIGLPADRSPLRR